MISKIKIGTRKSKLARFLIQRGFEGNLVWDKIREFSNK